MQRVSCSVAILTVYLAGGATTAAGLDLFTSHGKVKTQQPVDIATKETGWVLSNARGVIYRGSLQPGDYTSNVNQRVRRFKDKAARLGQGTHDGIYSSKITIGPRGTISYHVKVYANLSAATDPEMVIHFFIGSPQAQAWGTSGKWRRTRHGWVAGKAQLVGF